MKFDRLIFCWTAILSPCSLICSLILFTLQDHFQFISTSIIQFTEPATWICWVWRIVDFTTYFPAVHSIVWIFPFSQMYAMLLVQWRQDKR